MFRHDSPDEAAFRADVRTWLEANLPASLRGRTNRPPPAELMPWYKKLARKGWIAPHWRDSAPADHHDRGVGAGRCAASAGARAQSQRPDPDRVRQRGAEGKASA